MGKRKTLSEETGKQKMDAPMNIDGSDHPANPLPNPPETFAEEQRPIHEGFMREALAMAQLALETDETPVACVFVHDGKVIARGMNATNRTMNGTRHAEFQAIASILSPTPLPDIRTPGVVPESDPNRPKYTADVLKECDLYVTVEPCIMCASLLRQFGICKVYFGAANDRFGGTGGVMNIHSCSAVDPPYEVSGGWLREEAIMMLRRFYVQENGKAPVPRPKKERVLREDFGEAGKAVNRVVGRVEKVVEMAMKKKEEVGGEVGTAQEPAKLEVDGEESAPEKDTSGVKTGEKGEESKAEDKADQL